MSMKAMHTTIGQGGRVVIPASFRAKYGLAEGDGVVMRCDETGIHIDTPALTLARLKRIAKTRLKKRTKHSVVDSFLAERRLEAKREA
jgi:AbrB family looped-hinge helix DNA binding protein